MEEVHLWRGTPEQRAERERLTKTGQFAYFDAQLGGPRWAAKRVLDFGGNAGNLLLDPACTIRHEDYYCLDVVRDALELGRERFPRAHFSHYDRYNCSFNPEGVAGLPVPDLGVKFDVILAFSVFTHTTRAEMRELTGQLRRQLAPGGVLAFTFCDPHARTRPAAAAEGSNLRWRLEKSREMNPSVDVERLLEESRGAEWCALVDGARLYVGGDGVWREEAGACMTYNVFYTADFMRREFPGAVIRPPACGEMQHCCLLVNGE